MTLWESYAQNSLVPARPELVLLDRHLPNLLGSPARHISMPARPRVSLQRPVQSDPWSARTLFVAWFSEGSTKARTLGTILAIATHRNWFYPWLNRSCLDPDAFAGDPHF